MWCAIIGCTDYTQVKQNKPQKKQRKSLKQRLREMKKSAVDESDSEADDGQDDTTEVENNHSGEPSSTIPCPNNNEEERNTAPQANNNEREESSSIPTITNANQPKAIINENTLPSILLELDDHLSWMITILEIFCYIIIGPSHTFGKNRFMHSLK